MVVAGAASVGSDAGSVRHAEESSCSARQDDCGVVSISLHNAIMRIRKQLLNRLIPAIEPVNADIERLRLFPEPPDQQAFVGSLKATAPRELSRPVLV